MGSQHRSSRRQLVKVVCADESPGNPEDSSHDVTLGDTLVPAVSLDAVTSNPDSLAELSGADPGLGQIISQQHAEQDSPTVVQTSSDTAPTCGDIEPPPRWKTDDADHGDTRTMSPRAQKSLLQQLREKRGLSQPALADLVGTAHQQIAKLELGQRKMTLEWAERLAPHLGVSPLSLLGLTGKLGHTAPLVGYLGAAGMVLFNPAVAQWGTIEQVEAPPGAGDTRAVRVQGKCLQPRYDDGDLLFLDLHPPPIEEALGRECIVQVRGGPAFVGHLSEGSIRGRYMLTNVAAKFEVDVEWACPVRYVARA